MPGGIEWETVGVQKMLQRITHRQINKQTIDQTNIQTHRESEYRGPSFHQF